MEISNGSSIASEQSTIQQTIRWHKFPHDFETMAATSSSSLTPRLLLVIAHPDDEAMFFSPLLLSFHSKQSIFILCLSNGNIEGLGEIRTQEVLQQLSLFSLLLSYSTFKTYSYLLVSFSVANIAIQKLWGLRYQNKQCRSHQPRGLARRHEGALACSYCPRYRLYLCKQVPCWHDPHIRRTGCISSPEPHRDIQR